MASVQTTRKITGSTYRYSKSGVAALLYTPDGDLLGRVEPTRGLASDWGNKWQTGDNGRGKVLFLNLAEAADYFAMRLGN